MRSPGRFEYRVGLTLADALALAGQPLETAHSEAVSLIHKDGSKEVVDIRPMLQGTDTATARLPVKPDDIILVPVQHLSYIMLGAVARPGILPWEEKLHLTDGLARAGGPIERVADTAHLVMVRRTDDGKPPVVMEAGDTVYIPSLQEKDWRQKLEVPLFLLSIAGTLNALFHH